MTDTLVLFSQLPPQQKALRLAVAMIEQYSRVEDGLATPATARAHVTALRGVAVRNGVLPLVRDLLASGEAEQEFLRTYTRPRRPR